MTVRGREAYLIVWEASSGFVLGGKIWGVFVLSMGWLALLSLPLLVYMYDCMYEKSKLEI